ncbi:MAG: RNA methyltransferase [Acidobacteria bacterium]|nr:RNA methyltransferase [Acidobacteriota bacterium]
MTAIKTISSRRNPLVDAFRALKKHRGADEDRILVDGAHLLADACAAGLRIDVAALSARALHEDDPDTGRLRDALLAAGGHVVAVTDAVLEVISPVTTPSGFVAIARRPRPRLEDFFRPRPSLVVILVGVQDPGNVGATIRAAEAGHATGVITAGRSADPYGWKALRAAMGSAFRLPVLSFPDLPGVLESVRKHGVRVVATSPRDGVSVHAADLTAPLAFLIGGEGSGLDDRVIASADGLVSIPMRAPVESLNTAVAAALFVYEASRQRGAFGKVEQPRARTMFL